MRNVKICKKLKNSKKNLFAKSKSEKFILGQKIDFFHSNISPCFPRTLFSGRRNLPTKTVCSCVRAAACGCVYFVFVRVLFWFFSDSRFSVFLMSHLCGVLVKLQILFF